MSRPCGECRQSLGQLYGQGQNAFVHLQLLQADVNRGIIGRLKQLGEMQHEVDSLRQQTFTLKVKCDAICAEDW